MSEDRTFIQASAQTDARVWDLAIAIARALVRNADEQAGDGVGHMRLYVTEWRSDGQPDARYVSIEFVMPAGPVDAALAKVGIRDADLVGDAQAQRAALLELE